MGKLDNLVSDIATIFKESSCPSEDDLKQFADDVLSVIRKSFEPRVVSPNEALRFSSIGKPDRQLWYSYNKPEIAEELRASAPTWSVPIFALVTASSVSEPVIILDIAIDYSGFGLSVFTLATASCHFFVPLTASQYCISSCSWMFG